MASAIFRGFDFFLILNLWWNPAINNIVKYPSHRNNNFNKALIQVIKDDVSHLILQESKITSFEFFSMCCINFDLVTNDMSHFHIFRIRVNINDFTQEYYFSMDKQYFKRK